MYSQSSRRRNQIWKKFSDSSDQAGSRHGSKIGVEQPLPLTTPTPTDLADTLLIGSIAQQTMMLSTIFTRINTYYQNFYDDSFDSEVELTAKINSSSKKEKEKKKKNIETH